MVEKVFCVSLVDGGITTYRPVGELSSENTSVDLVLEGEEESRSTCSLAMGEEEDGVIPLSIRIYEGGHWERGDRDESISFPGFGGGAEDWGGDSVPDDEYWCADAVQAELISQVVKLAGEHAEAVLRRRIVGNLFAEKGGRR